VEQPDSFKVSRHLPDNIGFPQALVNKRFFKSIQSNRSPAKLTVLIGSF